jgi:hypothetical protein
LITNNTGARLNRKGSAALSFHRASRRPRPRAKGHQPPGPQLAPSPKQPSIPQWSPRSFAKGCELRRTLNLKLACADSTIQDCGKRTRNTSSVLRSTHWRLQGQSRPQQKRVAGLFHCRNRLHFDCPVICHARVVCFVREGGSVRAFTCCRRCDGVASAAQATATLDALSHCAARA